MSWSDPEWETESINLTADVDPDLDCDDGFQLIGGTSPNEPMEESDDAEEDYGTFDIESMPLPYFMPPVPREGRDTFEVEGSQLPDSKQPVSCDVSCDVHRTARRRFQ